MCASNAKAARPCLQMCVLIFTSYADPALGGIGNRDLDFDHGLSDEQAIGVSMNKQFKRHQQVSKLNAAASPKAMMN